MSLERNVLLNLAGQGWSALLGILFVPAYAASMGIEAYGLVGAFTILYALMSVMDLGVTPTLSREFARLQSGARSAESARDLLRSIETVSAGICICMSGAIWIMAPVLANHWLDDTALAPGVSEAALRLMAMLLAGRWLEQVFRGALQGLQDFAWLNLILVVSASFRWIGAYVLVIAISTDVLDFFVWQLVVSIATVFALVARTYAKLPVAQRRGRFSRQELEKVRRFASGMVAVSILALALAQIDRVAVSTLLPLGHLGVYAVATTAAGGLMQLASPISTAIHPQLTHLVATGDIHALRDTYLRSCQWIAAVMTPPALLMVTAPDHVMLAWSGDEALSSRAAILVSILAGAFLLNGLMAVPYMLQLAHGWTSFAVRVNLLAVAVMIPGCYLATKYFGTTGAAGSWLLLNLGYVLCGSYFMHRALLPDAWRSWLSDCVALPLAILGGFALIARVAFHPSRSQGESLAYCSLLIVFLYIAAMLAIRAPRMRFAAFVTDFRKRKAS